MRSSPILLAIISSQFHHLTPDFTKDKAVDLVIGVFSDVLLPPKFPTDEFSFDQLILLLITPRQLQQYVITHKTPPLMLEDETHLSHLVKTLTI